MQQRQRMPENTAASPLRPMQFLCSDSLPPHSFPCIKSQRGAAPQDSALENTHGSSSAVPAAALDVGRHFGLMCATMPRKEPKRRASVLNKESQTDMWSEGLDACFKMLQPNYCCFSEQPASWNSLNVHQPCRHISQLCTHTKCCWASH